MATGKGRSAIVSPALKKGGDALRTVFRCVRRLAKVDPLHEAVSANMRVLREEMVQAASQCNAESQKARTCVSLLCDLRAQGWQFRIRRGAIIAEHLGIEDGTPGVQKVRVRAVHALGREDQLRQPSTQRFISDTERRRFHGGKWVSIFSLMRDGRELAGKLRQARESPRGLERTEALRRVIDPYVQVVERGSRCPYTGMKLASIWRYFRHTWANSYRSIPGRNLWILVRDRAHEHHPVVGIAALGSAIIQIRPRDEWIGWTSTGMVAELRSRPTTKDARWLVEALDSLVGQVFRDDLIARGTVRASEIRSPEESTIRALAAASDRAVRRHRLYPDVSLHKAPVAEGGDEPWEARAQTPLFLAKRAKVLAQLLTARRALHEADFREPTKEALRALLETAQGRRAAETVVRLTKASHVGIDMLDITVCGAIQPYNPVLGGKLVAMLLTSPEVRRAYESRYADAPSVIASSMAGRRVCRKPQLVLLGTTSLYGVGSSQYNRIAIPAEAAGGKVGEKLRYVRLGNTLGYGSYHLSAETVSEIEVLLARSQRGRRVNSIFGEGVNPRLRKLRTGLELVGFPSDIILKHGNTRIVYGVPLASNFGDVLLGRASKARYVLPQTRPRERSDMIARYWMERWLSNRIERDDVLSAVEKHTLVHPITHGARVRLPSVET